ncbi:DUF2007 domain-containing protein [Kordiimonas sp.]|uniref:putative signal transducing protein n=1 Tax=Kordiimonas sp. TaxID=1970157 RepID=UPI003A8E2157
MTQVFEDHNRLVVLRSGLSQPDGALLRSVLESHGIHAFLSGEHVAGMNEGLWANLMVRAADYEDAQKALSNLAMMPSKAFPVRHDADGEELACLRCGSGRVHAFEGRVPTSLPFVKVMAERGQGWYHCLQCGSYYNDRRPRFSSLSIALMWGGTLALATLIGIWIINWIKWL